MLKLLIQDDEGRKTLVPFSRDEITIGREDGNTIRLTERNVSRRHARLFRHSAQIFIEDLKSHNGIHLNGRRIRGQAVVRKGDTIAIGDYDIVLEGNLSVPPTPLQKTQEDLDAADSASPPSQHPAANEVPPPEAPPALPSAKTDPSLIPLNSEFAEQLQAQPLPPAPQADIYAADTLDLEEKAPTHTADAENVEGQEKADDSPLNDVEENHPARERLTVQLPEFTELQEAESPRLVALNLNLRGREFVCCRSEFSLGHSNINDLVLKHSSVAPVHCRIERDEKGLWFLAVDTRYPVLVNGEPYQQFALENGDIITVGQQELQFFLPSFQQAKTTPLKKKAAYSAWILPVAIGLLLAILVVLGFLYLYWSIGELHESSSTKISSLAHQYLPLPPPLQASSGKPPPTENRVEAENTPPTVVPPSAETETPAAPAPPTNEGASKSETTHLKALQTPQKPPEGAAPSKVDKALDVKTAARNANKALAPVPVPARPSKIARDMPRDIRATKTGPSAPAESTEVENTAAPPFNDMDLFWEDVYFLKKKAEREFSAPVQRATLSSLYDKLSGCETARCAYELAKTSLELSKLGSARAKMRFPDEFEAYLKMQDTGKVARARKEDACKTLLNHYNSMENATNAQAKTKVQAISEICTR